jgi:hypothetical protein
LSVLAEEADRNVLVVDIEPNVEHGCLLKSMYLGNAADEFQVTRLTGASFTVSTPTRATASLAASVDPTDARKHVRTPDKPYRQEGESCGNSLMVIIKVVHRAQSATILRVTHTHRARRLHLADSARLDASARAVVRPRRATTGT